MAELSLSESERGSTRYAKALAFLSVKAIPSGGSVRYIRSDSGVRVIYACAEPHQGSMIIFRFKALSNVQTSPVFTPIEAAESDTVLRSYDSALQLDLSIGQKSSSRTSPVSKTTVPRTTSGERERVDPRSLSERDSSANESGPVGRMDLRDHTRSVNAFCDAVGFLTSRAGGALSDHADSRHPDRKTSPKKAVRSSRRR